MKQIILATILVLSLKANAQDRFLIQEKSNVFYINHLVAKGESLYQIARDYHVKPASLMKFNEMGNETSIKYGQKIQIPLMETNYFKMGGLAEENGYSPLLYSLGANESLNSVSKKYKVSEQTLSKWNGGSSFSAGEQLIVGWIKHANAGRNTNAWAKNATKPKEVETQVEETIVASEQINEVVENTVSTESESTSRVDSYQELKAVKAEKGKELNPRYIDPNAPKVQTPAKTYSRNYTQYSKPVKKEAIAIKDDSQDAWYAVKRLFGAKNKKKNQIQSEGKVVSDEAKATTKNAGQYSTNDLSVTKPSLNTPTKPTNKTYTKPAYTATQPAPKPVAKKDNGQRKTNEVWTDFKSIFKSKKDKSTNKYTSEVAEIKPVKKDPNRTKTPEQKESKTKELWADLKTSFKSDKEKTDSKYYNVEPKTKESAPKTTKVNTPAPKVTPPASKPSKPKPVETPKSNPIVKKAEPVKKVAEKPTTSSTPVVVVKKKDETPVVDPVVRNEIKSLNLSRSSSGRASYFFGGPSGGKFYVATNLASKGQVVKVVNPENGKFVMAEVISSLPSSDAAKGILLKLSDNAKLPLGQRNGSFNVKVNY